MRDGRRWLSVESLEDIDRPRERENREMFGWALQRRRLTAKDKAFSHTSRAHEAKGANRVRLQRPNNGVNCFQNAVTSAESRLAGQRAGQGRVLSRHDSSRCVAMLWT